MMFSIIGGLKLKQNVEWEGSPAPRTTSTKMDSFSSIDSLNQSFTGTVFMGSVCVISVIITKQLISRFVDGSQNISVFRWSNATQFLGGKGIRDEVCWGKLPLELWGEIGKRMVNPLDIVYFRSVCKGWRSSLPSPTRFPLRMPPPPNCDPDLPYNISEATIYDYKRGWAGLPSYMQMDQGSLFSLTVNMCCRGHEVDFQKASLLPSPKVTLSKLCVVAKAYFTCTGLDIRNRIHKRQYNGFPNKFVLISSSNAYGVNANYASASDLSVVAFWGGKVSSMKGRLALLRLGGPSENWIWDTDFCTRVFVRIATYRGMLCTLDGCGRAFLMDYHSLHFTQVCDPLDINAEVEDMSLFEACGDLYLFDFKLNTSDRIEAYKLSLRLQRWIKVKDMSSRQFSVIACLFL